MSSIYLYMYALVIAIQNTENFFSSVFYIYSL